ncbi:hypothetical protein ADEAN_000855500 [Angomonas deanei]|uniref:Uncharacterized protein n=1 Tax=Angomonas deanei TaxID=59799 RepID=A0A7G2CMH1_9TRYP|nr:hypothetical protein ADEAN_000855500 [Angomonas deanei]
MIDHFCVSLLEGNLNLYYVYYMLRGDTFCETLFEDCVQRHYTEHERKRNEAKNNQNGNEVAMKQKDSPCGWLSPKETDALRSYVQGLYTNFVEDVVSFLLNLLQEKS